MNVDKLIEELEEQRRNIREVAYTWAIFGKARRLDVANAKHETLNEVIAIVKRHAEEIHE